MWSIGLHRDRAVRVNLGILPASVRLRPMPVPNAGLAHKLNAMEPRYDRQFPVARQWSR